MKCDTNQESTGKRLSQLMEKRGMTQEDLSKALGGYSRGYIDKWIHGGRPIPAPYAVMISELFGVDLHYLLKGVPYRNETAVADLGLNSDAVDFLRELAASENDSPVPITWVDGWTDEEEATVTSPAASFSGLPTIEAVYPSEILYVLNYLLTQRNGKTLLSLLYKYAMIDPSSAQALSTGPHHEEASIPADDLLFSSLGNNHIISISPWDITFALKEQISAVIEEIKNQIRKEANGNG